MLVADKMIVHSVCLIAAGLRQCTTAHQTDRWTQHCSTSSIAQPLVRSANKLATKYGEVYVMLSSDYCIEFGFTELQSSCVCVYVYGRKCIASTHGDHTIRITDVQTGKCTHVLEGHPRTPWCIAFHPLASDILASGCLAGEVRIWDLKVFGQFIVFLCV